MDYARLDAAWLARMAHDAADRGDLAALGAIKAAIARRPAVERAACSREWIRQASARERARHAGLAASPQEWDRLEAELKRLVRRGLGGGRERAESKPAGFDPLRLPESTASGPPEPHAPGRQPRWDRWLSDHAGLKDLGVNLTRMVPGTRSPGRRPPSLRDEFIYVLSGEVVLSTGAGEEVLRAGMCAGFPAGTRDEYWFLNRSGGDALLLVVGDPRADSGPEPDRRHGTTPKDGNAPAC